MKCESQITGTKLYDVSLDNYVVFDLETTGLIDAEIVEFGAVRVRDGKVTASFSQLCNPGIPIDPDASKVNGITDEMVADKPSVAVVLEEFLEFIGNDILLAHSSNDFDMNFLWSSLRRNLGCSIDNDYANTLHLCRHSFPKIGSYKLTALAEFFHIDYENAHRAVCDAEMTQKLYEYIKPYIFRECPRECIFGEHDPNIIFEAMIKMIQPLPEDLDKIKLKINKTSISVRFFKTVAFNIRINSRTQCLDTSNSAAKIYVPLIPGATYKNDASHFPLDTTTNAIPHVIAMLKDVYYDMRDDAYMPTFGCCNDFIKCSDALQCLHKDKDEYRHCYYRTNLEAGRIFYGNNKNI